MRNWREKMNIDFNSLKDEIQGLLEVGKSLTESEQMGLEMRVNRIWNTLQENQKNELLQLLMETTELDKLHLEPELFSKKDESEKKLDFSEIDVPKSEKGRRAGDLPEPPQM